MQPYGHPGSWNKRSGVGPNGCTKLSQQCSSNELCESYNSFNTNYHDAGLFGMYAIAPKEKLQDLSWAIMQAMTRMCYNVSEEEVIRARNSLKTMLIFQSEGTTGNMLGADECKRILPLIKDV